MLGEAKQREDTVERTGRKFREVIKGPVSPIRELRHRLLMNTSVVP